MRVMKLPFAAELELSRKCFQLYERFILLHIYTIHICERYELSKTITILWDGFFYVIILHSQCIIKDNDK